jgi:hypothetical protein
MLQRTFRTFTAIAWPDVVALLPVAVIQAGILLVLGQPFITFGAVAVAVGIAAGIVKNRPDSGSFDEPARPRLVGRPDIRVPVTLLLTEEQLAKIDRIVRVDSALRSRNLPAGRRRFIMRAVDEKLERARSSDWPLAA